MKTDYYRSHCWKIQLCKHYLAGRCFRKSPCPFAHDLWELQPPSAVLRYATSDYPESGCELTETFKAYVDAFYVYGQESVPRWVIGECLDHNYYPPGYDDEDLFQDLRASKRTAAPDVDDLRGDSYEGGGMPRSMGVAGGFPPPISTTVAEADDLFCDSFEGGEMPHSIGVSGGDPVPIDTTGAESMRSSHEGVEMTQSICAEGDATPPIGTTVSEAMPKKKGMNKISARYR